MDLLFAIIEGLGVILDILDLLFIFGDVISWIKGKENRIERKSAKRSGDNPPKRNAWNRIFLLLSIFVIILTSLIIIRILRK
jgi:hypothetical protein